ncbi:hypothetical protein RHGRI_025833 [Rhododendron griersonianum]|uniref:Uncharacterized protein n=1 Tax=Rhododendron griersonianum TaxID=479676 RepID=A0AAV6IU52_9ERIC|nr:hypothetical protein RHGRI_025833 [Rhododendron griersonianum]
MYWIQVQICPIGFLVVLEPHTFQMLGKEVDDVVKRKHKVLAYIEDKCSLRDDSSASRYSSVFHMLGLHLRCLCDPYHLLHQFMAVTLSPSLCGSNFIIKSVFILPVLMDFWQFLVQNFLIFGVSPCEILPFSGDRLPPSNNHYPTAGLIVLACG